MSPGWLFAYASPLAGKLNSPAHFNAVTGQVAGSPDTPALKQAYLHKAKAKLTG
jgi:hypothetical protein